MTLVKNLTLSPQMTPGSDFKWPLVTYFTTADPPASIVHTLWYITYSVIPNTNLHGRFQLNHPFSSHDLEYWPEMTSSTYSTTADTPAAPIFHGPR